MTFFDPFRFKVEDIQLFVVPVRVFVWIISKELCSREKENRAFKLIVLSFVCLMENNWLGKFPDFIRKIPKHPDKFFAILDFRYGIHEKAGWALKKELDERGPSGKSSMGPIM